MKINYILIALTMVAALTMVSCKNNKKAQSQEPTQEEVQEMKQALADSVLAEIDALAEEYIVACENGFSFKNFDLTEKEKQIKPDYLLDPFEANKFVTKSQKVNALAFYLMDLGVRKIYDMPLEETKEAIAKLILDINYPIDIDLYETEVPLSERIKMEYGKCKENGDLAYFWQFQSAVIAETGYILVHNPELFFSKISEEQWQYDCPKTKVRLEAMETIANYDEEMASLLKFWNNSSMYPSIQEGMRINSSLESAKQFRIANKDKFIARRNALLQ